MTTKELINQYVTAHADNRWMDASELEALLTEFAEKLIALQPKTRETLFREYMQATPAERRKFDLSFLSETRKEALAILTDLGYECKLPQEPASEDLEKCVVEQMEADGDVDDFVRRGIDDIASKYAQLGAQWQKEQMRKDAIECHIDYYDGSILDYAQKQLDDTLEKNGAKVGDKVKVIIIKE